MTNQLIFIQLHGEATIIEAEISAAPTVGELHELLVVRDIRISAETLIFIDEAEHPIHGAPHEPLHGVTHGGRVHLAKCREIAVTVHFLASTAARAFAPGARVRSVKEWAVQEFKLSPKDAAEHVLQLTGTAERPASDTPLHQLVHGHSCAVAFDFVPDKRIEG